ncbi:hypothetical protein ACFX2H_008310 [Malus domestica]|uniref:Uncharacterized protein n=1 Tax=Malus domestica TaxID=3750 RepID=A0A498IHR3_MALDO|nr:hypothetical protein DVH24_035106 [Malus domestica]
MVLNSHVVVRVANISANLCQYIACNPERLSSHQVLHLLFCFPLHHLRRRLVAFLCLPFLSSSDDDDDDDEDDDDSDLSAYSTNSHSD